MHPKLQEVLRVLTEEEMAQIVPVPQEEIEAALEKGCREAEDMTKYRDCRLPSQIWYR